MTEGPHRLTFRVRPAAGEIVTENNTRDALTDLSSLSSLATLGKTLGVSRCDALADLGGLLAEHENPSAF